MQAGHRAKVSPSVRRWRTAGTAPGLAISPYRA